MSGSTNAVGSIQTVGMNPAGWCSRCSVQFYGHHFCPYQQQTYPSASTSFTWPAVSRADYDALAARVAELEAQIKRLVRPRPHRRYTLAEVAAELGVDLDALTDDEDGAA